MFDWDQDFDDVTSSRRLPQAAAPVVAAPRRGHIRRALITLGLPVVVVVALFAAPSFAPASSGAALGGFGLSRLTLDAGMPDGLLSYDQTQYDNFCRGIVRFSNSELLAFAAATRRDQANARRVIASWDRDALRLADREIARRGLQSTNRATQLAPQQAAVPIHANAI